MTVSSTATKVVYAGDGSTTQFATVFPFFDAAELEVIEREVATGAETVKTLGTHYTVTGGQGEAGTVIAVAAPPASVQWTLRRRTALTQLTDYTPNDPFPAETHEKALDRAALRDQELREELDRALRIPASDPAGIATLLASSLARANRLLGFDGNGQLTYAVAIGDGAQYFAASIVSFTGDGTTAAFALPFGAGEPASKFLVTVANVVQEPSAAYSIGGGSLIFAAPPVAGAKIVVRYLAGVSLGYTPSAADALKLLRVNASGTDIEATSAGGGGGGAPAGAAYLVLALDAGLSDERVLAAGSGLGLSDGGAGGSATLALAGQALAFHALAASGLVARTGAGSVAARTLTAPASGIAVTNGDGVAGNPTLALANDLAAVEALAAAGIAVRTGTDAWAARTIAAGTGIVVTNGDGVAGNPAVAVDTATAAEIRANTADQILDTDGVWAAADLVTLADGATVTPDFAAGFNFTLTLGGNRTLANPTNPKNGQSGLILIKQDATGGRTLAFGANWKFPGGGAAPALTATAGRTDKLFYFVESATRILASLEKDTP